MIKLKHIYSLLILMSFCLISPLAEADVSMESVLDNAFECHLIDPGTAIVFDEPTDIDKKPKVKKDTVSLGIGPALVDSTDKNVSIEDTLVYEDFDIIIKKPVVTDISPSQPVDDENRSNENPDDFDEVPDYSENTDSEPNPEIEKPVTVELNATVFPNPAMSDQTIRLKTGTDVPANIRIMDMSGRLIDLKTDVVESTELGNYSSGSYFIIILTEEGATSHKKLIVK